MDEAFAAIFNVVAPYGRFQTEPAKHLLAGRNVILQAPTGSGKTKAALFPYLLARQQGLDFPRKMLYCVPMRVLARSFWDDLKKDQPSLDARLQTGEQQDDRRLEAEITFATVDQVLSSFLNIPYALSLRQGNVNAGAVVSSYLVFDEFHLLDPESTLPTTLEMLRMSKGITPFLLMTATFSQEMLARLASMLDAEVVTVSNEELRRIPTQRDKTRRFHRMEAPLTAEAVLRHHRTRSIAICNTVERAQDLFEELCTQAGPGTQVILLHSRFLREDRRQKEDSVRRFFGKDGEKAGSIILVATQVIEVGLDITCELMHTDVAPASAILQRAGRCARFEGEEGDVYVYQVPLNQKGEPNYAPYLGQQATLCEKTWEALPSFEEENMDFLAEQRLVNLVHAEADGRMLDGLEQARYAHRQEVNKAIGQQEIGLARSLIRHDDSVTILVHPNPLEIENPYALEGFSLFFGTLHGQFKAWQEAGLPNEEVSWLLKYPQEKGADEGEDRPTRYEWIVARERQELKRSAIHVVNPLLVTYDSTTGFRFGPGGGFQSPFQKSQVIEKEKERRGYRRESYQEHIQKMLAVYQAQLSKEMSYAANRLEQQMGLPKGSLERAVHLTIALHDVGKMDRRWQRWAHEWQRRIGAPVAEEYMLAHTDYNPDDPRHQSVEAEMPGSRPPHAAEGAVAVFKVLYRLLGMPGQDDPSFKLMKAVFSAIARHHSPRADSYQGFDLHQAAVTTLAQVLMDLNAGPHVHNSLVMNRRPQPITGLLIQPDARDELLAYFLIVRALRLADQGAMVVNE
ncbi:MAG: CRISPR-associated helicase Cas3' [candidate division KSB1 bacterium]|nr:CRISPR-associated helicase Cas3' [candidate division KSB1 bacterium]